MQKLSAYCDKRGSIFLEAEIRIKMVCFFSIVQRKHRGNAGATACDALGARLATSVDSAE